MISDRADPSSPARHGWEGPPKKVLICVKRWTVDILESSLLGRNNVRIISIPTIHSVVSEALELRPDLIILDLEHSGQAGLHELQRNPQTAEISVALIAPQTKTAGLPENVHCLPRSEFSEWEDLLGEMLSLPHRTERRVRVALDGQVSPAGLADFKPVKLVDLSSGGAQVETTAVLEFEVPLELQFALPNGGRIACLALVRRQRGVANGYRYGLRFTEIQDPGRALLAAYLSSR